MNRKAINEQEELLLQYFVKSIRVVDEEELIFIRQGLLKRIGLVDVELGRRFDDDKEKPSGAC